MKFKLFLFLTIILSLSCNKYVAYREDTYRQYKFKQGGITPDFYYHTSISVKDSTLIDEFVCNMNRFKIKTKKSKHKIIEIERYDVEHSSQQDIINNIYWAFEIYKISYRYNQNVLNVNWSAFFEDYSLLNNLTLRGKCPRDTSIEITIKINELPPTIEYLKERGIINEKINPFSNLVGWKYIDSQNDTLLEIKHNVDRRISRKCSLHYMRGFAEPE